MGLVETTYVPTLGFAVNHIAARLTSDVAAHP